MNPKALLKKYPYGSVAFFTFFAAFFLSKRNSHPYVWVVAGAVLAFTAFAAFFRMPKPSLGSLGHRRRLETGIAGILSVAAFSMDPHLGWAAYLSFPLLLAFVYLGFRRDELVFTLCSQGTLLWWLKRIDIVSLVLLGVWVMLAFVFRYQEQKKRRSVQDRLKLYESEATTIERHALSVENDLRMEEKKRAHLASTLKEREKSFQNIIELIEKTVAAHTIAIYVFDATEDIFLLKEFQTTSDRFDENPLQKPQGIFSAILRERQTVRLVSSTGEVRGLTYYSSPSLVRSVAAIPLKTQSLLKGVLILDRVEAKAFSDEEISFLEKLATQLLQSIDQAEALHAYYYLMDELANFYATATELNRCLRVEDVVQTLLASAQKLSPYDWGTVVLYHKETDTNRIAKEEGAERIGFEERTFACAPERGLVSWAIKNQTPLYYSDFRSREGRTPLFHQKMRLPNFYESVLILPLVQKGESLGALVLLGRDAHLFSRNARRILEVAVFQAALTLKNARMVDQLERLATTDGLTGLVNHRTFQESLLSELERSARHPVPLSLLLIDIDFFKRFNDEYGHPVGDFVLQEIAQVVRRMVRKVDVVARYGGEEFAVILLNATAAGAYQMAQRIVAEAARSRFQHNGLTLRVTLSVGVSAYTEDAFTKEELIEHADRALYDSKKKGRNRATLFHQSIAPVSEQIKENQLIAAYEEEAQRV